MRLTTVILPLLVLAALSAAGWGRGTAVAMSTLDRPADPVVMTGAALPSFAGVAPGMLVAFKYEGGWQQVPVQVDERRTQTFGQVYNNVMCASFCSGAQFAVSNTFYADAGTHTGADPDPTIDANDEIAFMAKDAGGQAPLSESEPPNTIAGTGIEVTITDPLAPTEQGWVYLFEQDGMLSPGAGESYVAYNFNLLSGPYLSTYAHGDGPNPENSTVTTDYYNVHFSDRWQFDEQRITAGAATGVDILDRQKALFAPGFCGRSEDTFNGYLPDVAEGAFVINKSGPVRAIRSYVGANSGPLTQREHVFYEQRQDIRTFLRVHAIPSVMDFFDYSPAATGMTYYNDLNTGGVLVDGNPTETVTAGPILWQMLDGAQGSVVVSSSISTNIPSFAYTSYYLDDSTPPVTQCTGDAFAYGSSGLYINTNIPCTDPGGGATCPYFLNPVMTMYYRAPGTTVADAQGLNAEATAPLTTAVDDWVPVGADTDGDAVGDVMDNCPTVPNTPQADADTDDLGDACEAVPYGTNPADPDTDDDGCLDGREVRVLTFAPQFGGDRDPLAFFDFFDVNGDEVIDLTDAIDVLGFFGNDGTSPAANLRDRSSPNALKPWRTAAADDGIDLNDAIVSLDSFGHDCS